MSKLSDKPLEDLSPEELEKLRVYSEVEKNQAHGAKARQEARSVRLRVVSQPVTILLGIILGAFLIWSYAREIFQKETTLIKLESAIATKRNEWERVRLDSTNRALEERNKMLLTRVDRYTSHLDSSTSRSRLEALRAQTEIKKEKAKRQLDQDKVDLLTRQVLALQEQIQYTEDEKRRFRLIARPLRSRPNNLLSEEDAKHAIQELDFYEGAKNRSPLKLISKNGDKFVVDEVYSLMWQANDDGPRAWSTQNAALTVVEEARYGGFDDWRIPTLEEAMSLMRPNKQNKSFMDPVFIQSGDFVITSDRNGSNCFWLVDYSGGYYLCETTGIGLFTARAVRTME